MTRTHHLIRRLPTLALLFAIVAGALASTSPTAHADVVQPPKVFNVSTVSDLNDDTALGDGRCDTLPMAGDQCTLRAALAESAALSGNERIVVPAGTYKPNPGKSYFEIKSCVSIEGAGADKTLIDGDKRFMTLVYVSATSACASGTSFNNLTIQNAYGGGVQTAEGTNVVLNRVVVRDNQRNSFGFGAGIANDGTMLIKDSTIDRNINGARAGGIANTGTLHILRSTISNNESTDNRGGGIVNDDKLTIEHSTIVGNKTKYNGAGLLNNSSASALLRGVTITGNLSNSQNVVDQEGYGAGIANTGQVIMTNSLVAHNSNNRDYPAYNQHVAPDCAGTIMSLGFNLLGSLGNPGICALTYIQPNDPAKFTEKLGSLQNPIDPKLGELADNGGPTKTLLPKTGSPAIDSGTTTAVNCGTTDQRGRPRPFDGDSNNSTRCDIGAVEVVNPILYSLSPNSAPAGSQSDLAVEIKGAGFTAATTIKWNTHTLTPQWKNAGLLVVTVPAALLANPGTAYVQATDNNVVYSKSLQFTIAGQVQQQPQTITFGALSPKLISTPPFTIQASTTSGLTIQFGATGVCDIAGTEVTLHGVAGTCTITASQPGNAQWSAAAPVSQSFLVSDPNKKSQSIIFAPLPDRLFADGAFTVNGSASSGLPVSFSGGGSCSVVGKLVLLESAGVCTITASQPGDGAYNPALDVHRSFLVIGDRVFLPLVIR
jgi:hypothetical protein